MKCGLLLSLLLPCAALAEPWGRGTWEFKPGPDPFGSGALLSLRNLNESSAGEKGFVRLSADGNSFVLGDGRPVRFWAVGDDIYRKTAEEMDRHAAFLAALGVNMIRIHADIAPKDDSAPLTSVDEKEIAGILRMVAAAKKQGIYCTISPYWPHHEIPASWGIEGYVKKQGWGLFYFNDKLQSAYKAWVRELYSRKNPDTGLTLAQDPAVAVIQIMNEDSLLFWTSQNIEKPQEDILRDKFASWLAKKYGGPGAPGAWQGAALDGDDWGRHKPALLKVWDLTQPQSGGRAVRAADQTRFFAELQRSFNADVEALLRSLGCKQLVNAMNWRPADPVMLYDAERWSYAANEVMAVNKYYTGIHVGDNDGWRIDKGHHMTDESALLKPEALPTNLKQVSGAPFLITESTWVQPLGYQAEGPFLMGAYQALTGVDAYFWFSATDVTWALDTRMSWWTINGEHPTFKWSCSIPPLMGQFPAAALAYRLGYLRQAPQPAVHEERTLQDLWDRKVPIISEEGAFDPNRDQGAFAPASTIKQEVDRLAFLVGPVEVVYGGDPAKNRTAALNSYIDRAAKKVKSLTGEIELDYGTGLCKVESPAFQGFSGFVKKAGGTVSLRDLSLRSGNEYLTVYFVSMDGQPLAASSRVLVQSGTVSRSTGWETVPSTFTVDKTSVQGLEISHIGEPPWRIQNTDLAFRLRNKGLSRARILDVDGRPVRDLPLERQGDSVSLQTPPDWTYLILE